MAEGSPGAFGRTLRTFPRRFCREFSARVIRVLTAPALAADPILPIFGFALASDKIRLSETVSWNRDISRGSAAAGWTVQQAKNIEKRKKSIDKREKS